MPRVLEASTLRIGVSFHSFTLQTAAAGDPDLTGSEKGSGWGVGAAEKPGLEEFRVVTRVF